MSKYINFNTDLGPFVFKLLDTDFANFWLEHFLKVHKKYKLLPNKRYWPYVKPNDDLTNPTVQQLIEVANKINSIDYIVPLPEPIERKLLEKLNVETQCFLNRLHRYLVTATELRDRWETNGDAKFNFIPWENQEINYLFNLLNQTIHRLEEYVITPNREDFNIFLGSVEVTLVASQYDDCTVYEDDVDKEIPDSMMKDLRLYGHDVWIKKDILGKDFITAFADHDDPTQPDVRSPPMVSGGLEIDIDDSRKKLFDHPKFKSWLGRNPTNYQGSYPIGDITQKPADFSLISEFKFVSITMDQ
jgi:hypothetical protein|tara:strand:- start:70 stop:975 length:906 start_codon:yes stop_codon:yes gene_type:complete